MLSMLNNSENMHSNANVKHQNSTKVLDIKHYSEWSGQISSLDKTQHYSRCCSFSGELDDADVSTNP